MAKKITRATRAARPARTPGAAARSVKRNAKATGKAKAAEVVVRGSRRACEAPGCGKSFRAYVARQRFCSNGCRSRAFYWDFKDRTGERYAAHLADVAKRSRKRKVSAPAASRGRATTRRARARRA